MKIDRLREECLLARDEGLEVTLTIRNTSENGKPSLPPDSSPLYEHKLHSIIDKCHPALLLIEYKESSEAHYGGSTEQYKEQLQSACDMVHQQGALCANGGIEGDLVSLYLYQSYLDRQEKEKAEQFIQRAFDQNKLQMFTSEYFQPTLLKIVKRSKELISVYRHVPIDYVNLHWAQDDAEAFGEVVNFLKRQTGKQVISSEIKFPQDVQVAEALMKKVSRLRIPCAIWYFGVEASGASAITKQGGASHHLGKRFRLFTKRRFRRTARIRHNQYTPLNLLRGIYHYVGKHMHRMSASMFVPFL